jgi:hypothetical protein
VTKFAGVALENLPALDEARPQLGTMPAGRAGSTPSHRLRPGYWAVHAYRAVITGQIAAPALPLSMTADFGVIGILIRIALTHRRPLDRRHA